MKHKKYKRRFLKAGTTLLILGVAIAASIIVIRKPKVYTVTSARIQNIQEILKVTGDVKSNRTKTYYAMFTAPITELNVKEGDLVKEGDQVVTFDVKDLVLESKQSALAVQAAEDEYQSTVKQNEKNLLIYQGSAYQTNPPV